MIPLTPGWWLRESISFKDSGNLLFPSIGNALVPRSQQSNSTNIYSSLVQYLLFRSPQPRVYCKRELTWRQREKKRDRVKTDAKCIPDGSSENGSATTESIIVLFFFFVVDADPLHICWKAFTQWDMVIDSPSISSSVRAGILLSWWERTQKSLLTETRAESIMNVMDLYSSISFEKKKLVH